MSTVRLFDAAYVSHDPNGEARCAAHIRAAAVVTVTMGNDVFVVQPGSWVIVSLGLAGEPLADMVVVAVELAAYFVAMDGDPLQRQIITLNVLPTPPERRKS